MVALQIRDVPDDVRDTLAKRAGERGQSLQAFLLALVQAEARRSHNADVLRRVGRGAPGAKARQGETAAEVAVGRRQRAGDLDAQG